ncbi:hypothetical protein [Empedobacter brevis]|uniref:hypothetical protein n=1 Tax=Empedobacter brevis TaxID=247 RepID=UPI0039AEFF26
MKKNIIKLIILVVISIPIIAFISIFLFLEIDSNRLSINNIPKGYELDLNKNIYDDLKIINERKDSMYIFYTVGGKTSNSNLFFTKYYITDKFNFNIKIGNDSVMSEVKNFDTDLVSNFISSPSGIFNVNYYPRLENINIYVQNYRQISPNLYECNSKYLYMILNNEYTTLGIFKNSKFFIQSLEKKNYILLSIYSSDDNNELDLFEKIIK